MTLLMSVMSCGIIENELRNEDVANHIAAMTAKSDIAMLSQICA